MRPPPRHWIGSSEKTSVRPVHGAPSITTDAPSVLLAVPEPHLRVQLQRGDLALYRLAQGDSLPSRGGLCLRPGIDPDRHGLGGRAARLASVSERLQLANSSGSNTPVARQTRASFE